MPEEPDYTAPTSDETVSWTASEYIAHQKSLQWYLVLGGAAAVLALLIWLLTKDKISALVVIFGAALLGGYGARSPRELQYELTVNQLAIASKVYSLSDFRSFTVDDQQLFSSVNLMPLKRFAPGLSIYFSSDDEAAIIDLLAVSLPMEVHKSDPIDKLMRRIRF